MINKRNIWFLTLFSLILVLSVYYITMPSDLLINNLDSIKEETEKVDVTVEESDVISALKLENEEQRLEELDTLKLILMDNKSSVDDKNKAFEKMKSLDINKGEESKLEEKIKTEFKLENFIKIDGNNIKVVVDSDNKDTDLANKIMRSVQSNYDTKKYITVEFK